MQPVYEVFQTIGSWGVLVFVISSMLNVGLTQKPAKLVRHLHNRAFLLRMLLLNFIVVPALMISLTQILPLEPIYAAGLVIFSLAAGAPFLIKLTSVSQSDIALGATVLLVLMITSVVVMPAVLPLVLEGVTVDVWAIVEALVVQMLLPLVAGMVLLQVAEPFVSVIQPWVARLSNIALYVMVIAIVLGYLPSMADIELWKALGAGMLVLLLALFLGWTMGDGHGHLMEVGGLGTAQRNTAASLIVAQGSFEDPRVLVVIVLLNTFGVIMLIAAAKLMSKDNRFDFLLPVAADVPQRSPSMTQGESDDQP